MAGVFAVWAGVQPVGAAETLVFVHGDHLGSTAIIANTQGQVLGKQAYYPFGTTRYQKLDAGYQMPERQYTGQVSDGDETGLYYYNARYYNPGLGKFGQPDPIGQRANGYEYVDNNPMMNTDPSGYGKVMLGNGLVGRNEYWKMNRNRLMLHARSPLDEAVVRNITLSVFAENNQGFNPAFTTEIITWIMINRYNRGIAVFDGGFGELLSALETGYPELKSNITLDKKAEILVASCFENPEGCPKQAKNYEKVKEIVMRVMHKYERGVSDPTQGSLFFSHQNNLDRMVPGGQVVMEFENIYQLSAWFESNFAYYETVTPGFVGMVSPAYIHGYWSVTKGYYSGFPTLLLYGNEVCISTSVCGTNRKDSARLDRLDYRWVPASPFRRYTPI